MQTQDNTPMCYQRENQRTRRKPLCRPPSGNRSTRQSVGIHGLARDPLSLIYLMHLSPLSSYSNKASRNRVLSSSSNPAIHPIASAKAWLLPMLPNSTKTSPNTLKALQQNVTTVTNFSEENIFVTKKYHIVTKFIFCH